VEKSSQDRNTILARTETPAKSVGHPEAMNAATSLVGPREGDRVVAQDGDLGRVDRILRSESADPVYLVVAVGAVGRRRYPIVHCALVTCVDRSDRRIYVRGRRRSLERLPESPPLLI
jgi:hypothetical protein